jgi:hypothetical protein
MKIQFCFPKPFSSIALYKHRFAKVKTTYCSKGRSKEEKLVLQGRTCCFHGIPVCFLWQVSDSISSTEKNMNRWGEGETVEKDSECVEGSREKYDFFLQ